MCRLANVSMNSSADLDKATDNGRCVYDISQIGREDRVISPHGQEACVIDDGALRSVKVFASDDHNAIWQSSRLWRASRSRNQPRGIGGGQWNGLSDGNITADARQDSIRLHQSLNCILSGSSPDLCDEL